MVKTIQTVLKTSMGIIVVRKPGQRKLRLIETVCEDSDSDWRQAVLRDIVRETGLIPSGSSLRVIDEGPLSMLVVTELSDMQLLTHITTRAEDGTYAEEVTYREATYSRSVLRAVRALLRTHHLLKPT